MFDVQAMLTTSLIILAIVAPIFAGVLYIIRKKFSLTLGGIDVDDIPIEPEKPRYVDENVLFTVYRPKAISPDKWYILLAFAHLSEKRHGASPGAPEPADEVRRIAERFYGGRARDQMVTQQQGVGSIPERQVLTFVPRVEGVEFNPEEQQVRWLKDVHHADFEMRCSAESEGKTLRGTLTVYAGPFILADVPLAFQVDSVLAAASAADELFCDPPVEPYDKIFASYSHMDAAIVEQFEAHVESLGHRYLRDVYSLRSGEKWGHALEKLIEEAQVFQLFWSRNSMRSEFVRREWEHALSLGKPNFVRPVYWEEPLPREGDLPPQKLATIHFHKFDQPSGKIIAGNQPKITKGEVPLVINEDGDATLSHGQPGRKFLSPTAFKGAILAGFACVMITAYVSYMGIRKCVDCGNINANSNNSNIVLPTPTQMPSPTPSPVSASEDTAIRNKVKAALTKAGVRGVTVEVNQGVVTLKGVVPRARSHDALKAANESGAERVINQLTTK